MMNSLINWLIPKAQAFDFTVLRPIQDTNVTVQDLATRILNWVFIVAGILAVIYLVYAGIIYITAGGNPDAAKKGQQGIINAIIGIVIILLAFVIVQAVASLLK